jgi:hypothetical protein
LGFLIPFLPNWKFQWFNHWVECNIIGYYCHMVIIRTVQYLCTLSHIIQRGQYEMSQNPFVTCRQ